LAFAFFAHWCSTTPPLPSLFSRTLVPCAFVFFAFRVPVAEMDQPKHFFRLSVCSFPSSSVSPSFVGEVLSFLFKKDAYFAFGFWLFEYQWPPNF